MKQRTVLIALALLVLLFVTQAVAQMVYPEPPVPPARSYLCFEARDAAEVTRKANEAGSRGWKMVTSGIGNRSGIWCFEQLSAARPLEGGRGAPRGR